MPSYDTVTSSAMNRRCSSSFETSHLVKVFRRIHMHNWLVGLRKTVEGCLVSCGAVFCILTRVRIVIVALGRNSFLLQLPGVQA